MDLRIALAVGAHTVIAAHDNVFDYARCRWPHGAAQAALSLAAEDSELFHRCRG